jgi:hypothetical protein
MAETLAGAQGPILAYCRSGTRSTLLWALARASQGATAEELAPIANAAGYDITPVPAGRYAERQSKLITAPSGTSKARSATAGLFAVRSL